MPRTAVVRPWRGRIALFVDSRPVPPVFYALTDAPGGRWSWEEIPRRNLSLFAAAGIHLFQLDLWLEQMWTAPDRLDITPALRQIRGVLEVESGAGVVLRLHVNAPLWWCRAHPEECVGYADGPVDTAAPWGLVRPLERDLERCVRHSLSSELWRKEAGERVGDFCRLLAGEPEGDSLIGIHVADGVFGEWSYYGFILHEPDTGDAMTRCFRRWLARKYPSDAELARAWGDPALTREKALVPGMEARRRAVGGVFRTPGSHRSLIDYCLCHQGAVADSLLAFCRVVRHAWPRPILVGVFYGYLFSMFGRQALGGHLEARRVLESPDVDYLSGPQTYQPYSREVGGAGMSRGLLESCALHGKLWLDEMDQPTHLGFVAEPKLTWTRAEAVALLRRNVLHPLLRGHGLWYYDFGPRFSGGWWDDPVLVSEIVRLTDIARELAESDYTSPADVLMVCDPRTFLYTASGFADDPVSEASLDRLAALLYRSGVVFHMVDLRDLSLVDLGRYRVVVLANTWLLGREEMGTLRRRVARDGRHLVFVYAPGYTDGERLSVEAMAEVTGIRIEAVDGVGSVRPCFRAPGAAGEGPTRAGHAGWTSWYFPLPPEDPAVLRELFRAAGAHIWIESGDTLIAGWGRVCVHTKDGGEKTLTLPGGARLRLDLPPACTVLLDARDGRILIPPEPLADGSQPGETPADSA